MHWAWMIRVLTIFTRVLTIFTRVMRLKKELKRARLFEVQKIVKRLRALHKRRGTEAQLEKNRRKILRLQHELHLVKEINIADLCSRIITRNEAITQLTSQQQPPDKVKEKAEWRLLMSKKVCSCLREVMESSDPVEQCNDPGQDDRLKQGNRSSQPDRLRLEDSELKLVSTSPASTVSSGQPGDRLDSVFLTSLSAVSGTGYFGGEGMPHRSQKSKRNRPGQRSRRKLWEEKYGSDAKHLMKTNSKRKQSGTSTMVNVAPDDAGKERTTWSDTSDIIHPSWAAKRQVEAGIKQFQGQRIVFDSDSDSD